MLSAYLLCSHDRKEMLLCFLLQVLVGGLTKGGYCQDEIVTRIIRSM
jgi:hypothetical protein